MFRSIRGQGESTVWLLASLGKQSFHILFRHPFAPTCTNAGQSVNIWRLSLSEYTAVMRDADGAHSRMK